MVEPDVIQTIVTEKRADLAVAAAELIDIANQNGGRDNISVVLVRVPPEYLPSSGWAQRLLAKKKAKCAAWASSSSISPTARRSTSRLDARADHDRPPRRQRRVPAVPGGERRARGRRDDPRRTRSSRTSAAPTARSSTASRSRSTSCATATRSTSAGRSSSTSPTIRCSSSPRRRRSRAVRSRVFGERVEAAQAPPPRVAVPDAGPPRSGARPGKGRLDGGDRALRRRRARDHAVRGGEGYAGRGDPRTADGARTRAARAARARARADGSERGPRGGARQRRDRRGSHRRAGRCRETGRWRVPACSARGQREASHRWSGDRTKGQLLRPGDAFEVAGVTLELVGPAPSAPN